MEFLPYVMGVVFLALFGLHVVVPWRMRRLEGRPLPPVGAELEEKLQGPRPVVLYFYSPTCPKCAIMTPTVERLAKEYPHIVTVDITRMPELILRLSILVTPATFVVRSRQVVRVLIGVQSEEVLREYLNAQP